MLVDRFRSEWLERLTENAQIWHWIGQQLSVSESVYNKTETASEKKSVNGFWWLQKKFEKWLSFLKIRFARGRRKIKEQRRRQIVPELHVSGFCIAAQRITITRTHTHTLLNCRPSADNGFKSFFCFVQRPFPSLPPFLFNCRLRFHTHTALFFFPPASYYYFCFCSCRQVCLIGSIENWLRPSVPLAFCSVMASRLSKLSGSVCVLWSSSSSSSWSSTRSPVGNSESKVWNESSLLWIKLRED